MNMDPLEAFKEIIQQKVFPCVAAKDALAKGHIEFFTAGHLACPAEDEMILEFIYRFTENFRQASKGFHSAVVLFPYTEKLNEAYFETLLFQRLKSLRELDRKNFGYDSRVSPEPSDSDFSFSLMEEAFFIIGLHPNSSRPARQFNVPAIVFNPHVQFENLRSASRYEKMKTIVRKRDEAYSGSVNPMLTDFGSRSEIFQYSGKAYEAVKGCPVVSMLKDDLSKD